MKKQQRWISIVLTMCILLNAYNTSIFAKAVENAGVSGETVSISNEEMGAASEDASEEQADGQKESASGEGSDEGAEWSEGSGEEDAQSDENAGSAETEENAENGEAGDSEENAESTDSEESADTEVTTDSEETAEDSATDSVLTTAEEAQALEQEELVERKLYARAERVSAWEEKDSLEEEGYYTEQMSWAENLWRWMFDRDAEPESEEDLEELEETSVLDDGTILLEDDTPLVVEIEGMLPEDVAVVARYVEFAAPEDERSEDEKPVDEQSNEEALSECALLAVDIIFYRETSGEVYVPADMEMLTVTLKGETVSTAVNDGKPLLVYANAVEDRSEGVLSGLESGYVSSVRVFTNEDVDSERLGYEAGMDGDRFYFLEDGEELVVREETREEPELVSFKTYALNTTMAPLRFVVSAQQEEYAATAESDGTDEGRKGQNGAARRGSEGERGSFSSSLCGFFLFGGGCAETGGGCAERGRSELGSAAAERRGGGYREHGAAERRGGGRQECGATERRGGSCREHGCGRSG